MTSIPNKSLIYLETPTGYPIPGQTLRSETAPFDLSQPLAGGLILKTLALSLDPYMRGRMRDPSIKSYSPGFELGKVMGTLGVAKVLRSEANGFKEGDKVYGFLNMSEHLYIPAPATAGLKVLANAENLPNQTWCGAAGMPGFTAHYGFYEIGKPKKGEVIFVSAASGAVGQIVAQLAKKEGLFVIGSAGSDAKVDWLNGLGCFDLTFNYKTADVKQILEEHPVDIYFDNVGGETLDQVLATMKTYGRIIACGAISGYNVAPKDRYPIRNTFNIIGNQLTFQGFIISGKDNTKFYETVPKMIASGEIKIREHIVKGLDNGEAFLNLLTGRSEGKVVYVFDE